MRVFFNSFTLWVCKISQAFKLAGWYIYGFQQMKPCKFRNLFFSSTIWEHFWLKSSMIEDIRPNCQWLTCSHNLPVITLLWLSCLMLSPEAKQKHVFNHLSGTKHVSVKRNVFISNSYSESLLWATLPLHKAYMKLQTAYYHPSTNPTFYEEPAPLSYWHPLYPE